MADTATAVASDTIDKLAAMTADSASTRAYLTSVRGEIDELKRQAELALRSAEAATAAATRAKEEAIVAKNNAVVAARNAAAAKSALDRLRGQQTSYAADLQSQRADEAAALASARAESARLQAILVERARKAKLAEQRRIAAERAKAAAARKRGQVYVPKLPPATPANFLSYPANGPTTSGFGMRWHPILQKWMLHDGLDWGIACGTPVYAAASGTVIRAGWRESGWGNQILIDHGIHRGVDLVTSYNHLSSIVKWGGSVKRGQLIGYSGTTGYSTGCHLHFGTYEDGTPVNPRNWL
jgi:murein DD-endopeptidase MepM/ murein hydrolase activator NlpD